MFTLQLKHWEKMRPTAKFGIFSLSKFQLFQRVGSTVIRIRAPPRFSVICIFRPEVKESGLHCFNICKVKRNLNYLIIKLLELFSILGRYVFQVRLILKYPPFKFDCN